MPSWKALILSRVGLFVLVTFSSMSFGVKGRSTKIPDGFITLVNLQYDLGMDI